jgi:beta-xylosidase
VWPGDFPDPFVLGSGPVYYAYSTQVGLTEVPTIRSNDLVHWQWVGDALAHLPAWATWGDLWAPAVLSRGATFVMYYTTHDSATDRQCLSRAVSPVPQGPFVDSSTAPLVCQTDRGGSIDPSPIVDGDGTPYLQWQSEGTLNGEPPRIWSQQLTADGLNLVGQPSELIHQDQGWEFPIVEGPSMHRIADRYYLFYSANRWQTAAYAIGYAVCASLRGPCSKPTSAPLLASSGSLAGPGGPSVFTDVTGATKLAYHAWTQPDVGYPQGARRLHISTLSFGGGQPAVQP